jgi:hypothetical protein
MCSLRKEYTDKGWLDGNQGEPPPEPAQDSLPPAQRGPRRRSTQASTPTTLPPDKSPLDDESPLIIFSKMKVTSETDTYNVGIARRVVADSRMVAPKLLIVE